MTADLLIADRAAQTLDDALAKGAAKGGWLLAGPKGIGKGTIGRAFAAAHLSCASSLEGADENTLHLVETDAHPDCQVLRRQLNDKGDKLRTVIRVDDVRAVNERLFKTSETGRRAVIVDTADDMNPSSANAMLKSLEEPPEGTLFILLSRAVGGLLPTIRSRCRVVTLPPIDEASLASWLTAKTEARRDEALAAARAGAGAPGRALALLEDDAVLTLADQFVAASAGRGDLLRVAQAAGAKANEEVWPDAWQVVTDRLSAALRGTPDPVFGEGDPSLLAALDEAKALYERASGLNADRTQTALVLGRTIRRASRVGR